MAPPGGENGDPCSLFSGEEGDDAAENLVGEAADEVEVLVATIKRLLEALAMPACRASASWIRKPLHRPWLLPQKYGQKIKAAFVEKSTKTQVFLCHNLNLSFMNVQYIVWNANSLQM